MTTSDELGFDDLRFDHLWFENGAMGQKTRFVTLPGETGGRSFVSEVVTRPFAGRYAVPAHFHPAATETFEILAGRARYIVGRIEGTAGPGDRVVMPPGLPHVHPWSDSDEELRVRQTAVVEPPDLRGANASLQALVTICGLAGAGKVNRKGLPNLLQLAVLVQESMPATYLAAPPVFLQRLLFGVLGRLGRALGYRTGYPRYGVLTERGFERG
jgi:quercetin dioxygenase-like cupin family protein